MKLSILLGHYLNFLEGRWGARHSQLRCWRSSWEREREKERERSLAWDFETLKSTPNNISSNKAIPLHSYKTALPSGNQVLKYMNLWGPLSPSHNRKWTSMAYKLFLNTFTFYLSNFILYENGEEKFPLKIRYSSLKSLHFLSWITGQTFFSALRAEIVQWVPPFWLRRLIVLIKSLLFSLTKFNYSISVRKLIKPIRKSKLKLTY